MDLGSISFPRRIGVRFDTDYITKYGLLGMQARWSSYSDKKFENDLGELFYHTDMISRTGWAMYYFDGIYPKDVAYVKLEILNPSTGMLIQTFYFEFRKSYQTSLDARYYIEDPILHEKIVKNGILTELRRGRTASGDVRFKRAKSTFKQQKVQDIFSGGKKELAESNILTQTKVRYTEKAKFIFLVTPPHLMKYAKLLLILIQQLVNLNFDLSYLAKESQKPLYRTRFMLDELGNLQSDGHGIDSFQTMLSIGLGQEQQFTLILQTLQQLRDVYGESVDKIVQGNTGNIIFLKSTDDAMLDTLQKMSGVTHKVYKDGKNVTRDMEKLILQNEGKVTINLSVKEQPVIQYNDLAFLPKCNSIVFRAGDSPIWNRNQTCLPMSWCLFANTITTPGKKYSLQTVPTLSSAMDFDVRKNMPDFFAMWEKRRGQALEVESTVEAYKTAYGFKEADVARLDPDKYADEIMRFVNQKLGYFEQKSEEELAAKQDEDSGSYYRDDRLNDPEMDYQDNVAVVNAAQAMRSESDAWSTRIYCHGMLSREDLLPLTGGKKPNHQLDDLVIRAFVSKLEDFGRDFDNFHLDSERTLSNPKGATLIKRYAANLNAIDVNALKHEAAKEKGIVFSEVERFEPEEHDGYTVTDEFYHYMASFDSWRDLAGGEFEEALTDLLREQAADGV